MSDLRTAAQQALNYWESASFGDAVMVDKMDALRAALAQQAEPKGGGNLPPPLQAEPVATVAENATTQQFVGETPPSDYRRGYWDGFNIGKREGRIEAEDALAQQAEPVEPVAWVLALPDGRLDRLSVVAYDDEAEEMLQRSIAGCTLVPLYTAPPQRPAEPVEPVAYIHRQGNYWDTSERHLTDDEKARGWTEEPLYTAPPKRLPLTEEEIESCRQKGYAHAGLGAPFDFDKAARAVEKASWEKNNG